MKKLIYFKFFINKEPYNALMTSYSEAVQFIEDNRNDNNEIILFTCYEVTVAEALKLPIEHYYKMEIIADYLFPNIYVSVAELESILKKLEIRY